MREAYELVDAAGALLVAGTSLAVMSGLRFVRHAARQGKPIVIINRGLTRGDELASVRLNAGTSEALSALGAAAHRASEPGSRPGAGQHFGHDDDHLHPVHLPRRCRRDRPCLALPLLRREHGRGRRREDYEGTDVLLLGRVTYDSFAGAWPERETAGEVDAPVRQAARRHSARWWRPDGDPGPGLAQRRAHVDDVLATVGGSCAAAARVVGKVLVAGSISVWCGSCSQRGELDELHLLVHPVAARGTASGCSTTTAEAAAV